MYIDNNNKATYETLYDFEQDVQRVNNVLNNPDTVLTSATTWTNASHKDCYRIEFVVARNVTATRSKEQHYRFASSLRKNVNVKDTGYFFDLHAHLEMKFEFVGRINNVNGATVRSCGGEFRHRVGLVPYEDGTMFYPSDILEVFKRVNDMDSKYQFISVDTMIRYVSELYFRNPEYVVPSSMARYLKRYHSISDNKLLKY